LQRPWIGGFRFIEATTIDGGSVRTERPWRCQGRRREVRTLCILDILQKNFINLYLFLDRLKSLSLSMGLAGIVVLGLVACQSTPKALPDPLVVPPSTPVTAPPVGTTPPVVELAPKPIPKPPRIGLALGGGAARGFAHIGVIQVLEENGIHVDLVAGTPRAAWSRRSTRRARTASSSARWPIRWMNRRSRTGHSRGGA
jgi:hypothetical protein